MKIRDYLKDEIRRLNRRNDILEKYLNTKNNTNLALEEAIQKNALTMSEIAKAFENC